MVENKVVPVLGPTAHTSSPSPCLFSKYVCPTSWERRIQELKSRKHVLQDVGCRLNESGWEETGFQPRFPSTRLKTELSKALLRLHVQRPSSHRPAASLGGPDPTGESCSHSSTLSLNTFSSSEAISYRRNLVHSSPLILDA